MTGGASADLAFGVSDQLCLSRHDAGRLMILIGSGHFSRPVAMTRK